eukprot:scaffold1044_cov120-Isochrysis_galbana.AAC.11
MSHPFSLFRPSITEGWCPSCVHYNSLGWGFESLGCSVPQRKKRAQPLHLPLAPPAASFSPSSSAVPGRPALANLAASSAPAPDHSRPYVPRSVARTRTCARGQLQRVQRPALGHEDPSTRRGCQVCRTAPRLVLVMTTIEQSAFALSLDRRLCSRHCPLPAGPPVRNGPPNARTSSSFLPGLCLSFLSGSTCSPSGFSLLVQQSTPASRLPTASSRPASRPK